MTQTFNVKYLASNRALITGEDEAGDKRRIILDTTQWDQITAEAQHIEAHDKYDAAVAAFFKPLTDAADALYKPAIKDPAFYLVLQEPEAPSSGTPGVLVELTLDTAILKMIDSGNTDRLLWVGDTIEVLQYEAPDADELTFDNGN